MTDIRAPGRIPYAGALEQPSTEHVIEMLDNDLLLEPQEPAPLAGFWEIFKKISSMSLSMALAFTFSIELVVIGILINMSSETEDEVASAALTCMMLNIFCVVGMAPLFAMNVLATRQVGELRVAENNHENEEILQARREYISGVGRNGLRIAMAVTPPVVAALVFAKPFLVNVLGQDEQVAALTEHFLQFYSPAIPGLMLRIAIEQLMFAFGRAKQAMGFGLISLAIGSALSVLLGNGWLGFPKLGPSGIALGYVVEAYLTACAYSAYIALHPDFRQFSFFRVFSRFENQWQQLREMLWVGASIAASVSSEMAMSLSLAIFSGVLGATQQAAMSYLSQYISFNFLLTAGFGQGCSQELNRAVGARDYGNASRLAKYGLVTTLIYTTTAPIIFAFAPGLLIVSSSNHSQIEALLRYLSPIMSAGVIVDAARYNLIQQLRVLGDVKAATIISVSALALGIMVSGLLSVKTNMGLYGVALGYSGGIFLATPGLLYRWRQRVNPLTMRQLLEQPERPESSSRVSQCFAGFFNRRNAANEEEMPLLRAGQVSIQV